MRVAFHPCRDRRCTLCAHTHCAVCVQAEEETIKLTALRDSYDKRLKDLQSEYKHTLDTLSAEKVDLVSEKMTIEVQIKELLAEREVCAILPDTPY